MSLSAQPKKNRTIEPPLFSTITWHGISYEIYSYKNAKKSRIQTTEIENSPLLRYGEKNHVYI